MASPYSRALIITDGVFRVTTNDDYLFVGNAVVATSGDSSGSPGNATLNCGVGRSALPAGAGDVTITNSHVVAGDHVFFQLESTFDPMAPAFRVVTANGEFTVYASPKPTFDVVFSWFLVRNPW